MGMFRNPFVAIAALLASTGERERRTVELPPHAPEAPAFPPRMRKSGGYTSRRLRMSREERRRKMAKASRKRNWAR
jgi:hypothetical protein